MYAVRRKAAKSGAKRKRKKNTMAGGACATIWMLHCNQVIGNHISTQTAITTKWKNAITARLDIDHRLAKSNRKNYSKMKVLHTWSLILANPETLPPDWTINLEVLVGIKLPRPPAQTRVTW